MTRSLLAHLIGWSLSTLCLTSFAQTTSPLPELNLPAGTGPAPAAATASINMPATPQTQRHPASPAPAQARTGAAQEAGPDTAADAGSAATGGPMPAPGQDGPASADAAADGLPQGPARHVFEGEPGDAALRLAFLLPPKDSPFEAPALAALQGVLAANYASENPARILLVRPGADDSVVAQLQAAAMAGAMAAIGPVERGKVETLSKLQYVPLPVVTLNQVDLNDTIDLSPEEILNKRAQLKATLEMGLDPLDIGSDVIGADGEIYSLDGNNRTPPENGTQPQAAGPEQAAVPADDAAPAASTGPSIQTGGIASESVVEGLIYADKYAVNPVRYEARLFPRNLLMLGLSMEDDAAYLARMGVAALPEKTQSGDKPKVLLLDHDTPLEKRVSTAFERELIDAGFAPDKMTVDVADIGRVNKFFQLLVDKTTATEFNEVPIDQEADPAGWRRQQIRIRRLETAKRARAALSEPPYYAAFLAMDAKTASLVRSRLPLRTRIWGTPLVNPGDMALDPEANAMSYDLVHVALTEAPLLLGFDAAAFEQKWHVPAPKTLFERRLFAQGADAWTLACNIARGAQSGAVDGQLGTLHYNLSVSPLVERRGQTAMIYGGAMRAVTQEELLTFDSIDPDSKPLSRMRAQSRSLERLEREAERGARAAGTYTTEELPQQPEADPWQLQQTPPQQPGPGVHSEDLTGPVGAAQLPAGTTAAAAPVLSGTPATAPQAGAAAPAATAAGVQMGTQPAAAADIGSNIRTDIRTDARPILIRERISPSTTTR